MPAENLCKRATEILTFNLFSSNSKHWPVKARIFSKKQSMKRIPSLSDLKHDKIYQFPFPLTIITSKLHTVVLKIRAAGLI